MSGHMLVVAVPASSVSTCAVTKLAWSVARKQIALAMSSTVPSRPGGVRPMRFASVSAVPCFIADAQVTLILRRHLLAALLHE